jgi:DNA-directed RNA polymerase subunit RPC12/RpoP
VADHDHDWERSVNTWINIDGTIDTIYVCARCKRMVLGRHVIWGVQGSCPELGVRLPIRWLT